MENDVQKSIEIYKEQLSYGYIQIAYITLTKYVAELKGKIPKNYSTSSIGYGYLDYTYFYFTNDYIGSAEKVKYRTISGRIKEENGKRAKKQCKNSGDVV